MKETFKNVLSFYFSNIGCTLPRGHTWDELARAIQGSSEDPEFLLSIINDISLYGTKSKHVFKAIQTIKDWSSYTADKNQLPFKIAEGGKILRSPDRKQGLADVTRETFRIKEFRLSDAIVYSYFLLGIWDLFY